ncbi:MAG: Uma2 family endonuclease [Gemmataceae bacterium]|nr:Uma2 family endonuclease [Gemmataceae bacterium]
MATLIKTKPKNRTKMTVREYLALPTDDHCQTELVYGEMIVMPKPKPKRNRAIFYLGQVIDRWVAYYRLGMTFFDSDMVLDEIHGLVYAPDLLFIATENLSCYRDDTIFGPVDLAVEILSPSERPYLQQRKFADYEAYGIPWFWVIDPNGDEPKLREHELVDGIYECRSEIVGADWFSPGLFPGLTFRLPPLLTGDIKAAVKGKAKRLM